MAIKPLLKIAIFISLGLFLVSRLLNGSLNFYTHPRFNGLTMATAVALIIVGLVYARQQWLLVKTHGRSTPNPQELSWLAIGLLALPVLLGGSVTPRPLGATAFQNREIDIGMPSSVQAPSGSKLAVIATAGERNILDWLYLFQRSNDPATFNGEEVHLIGFVYRDSRFETDQFMVSRFTISCCAADAMPVGLIVQWPEADQLPTDQWVEVKGYLQASTFADSPIPMIIADEITETDAPAQPYLYQ